jgi:hypothetical protein
MSRSLTVLSGLDLVSVSLANAGAAIVVTAMTIPTVAT